MSICVKATDDQMYDLIKNVVNASKPFGMGYLHYKNKDYTTDEIKEYLDEAQQNLGMIWIDYFYGRMVKFSLGKVNDGLWKINTTEFNSEYQSFKYEYSTIEDLLMSVPGIELAVAE